METETQTDYLSGDHTPDELHSFDSVVDREFQFLNENVRSGSSSEEKLSSTPGSSLDRTPGSSLERGLEPRIVAESRSRSSSRERSLSESSPVKTSSDMKTPDTDLSDASLPLPPPPPPDILQKMMRANDDSGLPFRANLRKTKQGEMIRKSTDLEEGSCRLENSDEVGTVGSLEENNVKNVISRYGTIPKGARIGAFLASLEQNNGSKTQSHKNRNNTDKTFLSPTKDEPRRWGEDEPDPEPEVTHIPNPEVTRKVEEWRAGVERSMAEEQAKDSGKDSDKDSGNSTEHNVKPSALLRSSSSHTVTTTNTESKPGQISSLFQRQRSDLSSPATTSTNVTSSTTTKPTPTTTAASNEPKPHGSPLPEWRKAKPRPSPRIQPRKTRTAWDGGGGGDTLEKKPEKSVISTTVGVFPPRNPSSSSEEVVMENKHIDEREKMDSKKIVGSGVDYASTDCLRNKLSPPVPKKPGLGQGESGQGKSDDGSSDKPEKIDSVLEGLSKGRNKAAWDKDSPVGKLDFAVQLRPTTHAAVTKTNSDSNTKAAQTVLTKSRFPFKKQDSADKKDKEKSKSKTDKNKDVANNTKASPSSTPTQPGVSIPKPLLPGARPVLPGSKQVLPNLSSSGSSSPSNIGTPQRTQRVALQRVNSDKEKSSPTGESEPPSKEQLKGLSKKLSDSLETLNSTAAKHTSNFMHLSEEVQSFYDACSGYVESLPPHGKFHFRELLTTLQGLAENLKTCSGSNVKEYDKLLGKLQSTIRDIDTKLNR